MNAENGSFTEVYAGNILEAGFIKSLLEAVEITTYLKDEIMGTMMPWWTSPGGVGAVKVMVASADFDRARALIEEYRNMPKDVQPEEEA